MIPSPKSSRFWYSLSDLNPKSPSMVPSSSNRSPMTCAWSVSFLLYARALATMRAYFSAERSSLAANAALCAAPAGRAGLFHAYPREHADPEEKADGRERGQHTEHARHMPFPQQSGPSFATRVIHVVALDDPIPIHTTYRSTHVNTTGGTTDIGLGRESTTVRSSNVRGDSFRIAFTPLIWRWVRPSTALTNPPMRRREHDRGPDAHHEQATCRPRQATGRPTPPVSVMTVVVRSNQIRVQGHVLVLQRELAAAILTTSCLCRPSGCSNTWNKYSVAFLNDFDVSERDRSRPNTAIRSCSRC